MPLQRHRPRGSAWIGQLTRSPDIAPPAWRVASLAVLAAGAISGRWLGRAPTSRAVVVAGAGLLGALGLAAAGAASARRGCLAGRPGPTPLEAAGGLPQSTVRLTVLVPAHDEADVLPFLVADLGRQDLRDASGEPTFEVVVVDDRSVDGTGRIARAAAGEAGLSSRTSVVRREPASGPDGKATALAAVPDDLVRGEAVLVLDADARLAPDALRRVAGAFAAGHDALTMPRRVDGARLLDRLQDAEQVLDARLQRTRAALGGRPELRGNGMAVRTSILREVGGWRPGSLTEDLDLSTRLAVAGVRVRVVDDIVVHELPAASPADLAGQRLRWAEGAVRRHLELLPGALLAGAPDATVRLDLLAGALALAAAPALPAALAAAALGRRPATLVALLGAWLAGGTILSLAALREPGSGPARSSSRLLLAAGEAIYLLHWPLAIPTALLLVALRPGRARFRRTRRRPPAPKLAPRSFSLKES